MNYKNLFKPLRIGGFNIDNRLVMPAMSEILTNGTGDDTSDEVGYYGSRAKGGTGLIITSFCKIDPLGAGADNELSAYDNSHICGLTKITDEVHRYQSKILLQLHHAGRTADPETIHAQPMGPSAIPCTSDLGFTLPTPREMTNEEVKEMVQKFIKGATIAKSANFDGVELHVAHSYLLNQFVSPLSNHRTDEYGGSTENRARIVTEIIKGIKKICGTRFTISCRLSADEGIDGGLRIEESVKLCKLFEEAGADLINVSAGGYENTRFCIGTAEYEQGFNSHLSKSIKEAVNIPVTCVGMIRDMEFADRMIENGICDLIVMGRPHIADPNLVNKTLEGRENEIRPCLTCMTCVDSSDQGRMKCAMNPLIGREERFKQFIKNNNNEKVVVIGGGPAGCEATRVLAKRGFKVTLIEQENKLGGQVNIAAKPPHKDRMELLGEYYTNILNKLGVNIIYNTKATIDEITKYTDNNVFLATGADPLVLPIKGLDEKNVCTANEVLLNQVTIKNSKVVIVGSGNTGVETAEYLFDKNNHIEVVDMLSEIGSLCGASGAYVLMDLLKQGLVTKPNLRLKEFDGETLRFDNISTDEIEEIQTDFVVLAMGVKSNNQLLSDLRKNFQNVRVVGDALSTSNISKAVESGFFVAYDFLVDEEML